MNKPPSYVIELRKVVLDETGLHDAEKISFEISEPKYNECIDCASHSDAAKESSDKVLDVTLVKILEDFRMLSFNASSQHMQAISLYNAQEIVKQRLGEFVRGEQ